MGNMSYCRFQNTYGDLRDCFENMENEPAPAKKQPEQLNLFD